MTPFESQTPRNPGENTDRPNEFTDSEDFLLKYVAQPISAIATETAKHIGVDITLETTALRVMYNKRHNAAKQ